MSDHAALRIDGCAASAAHMAVLSGRFVVFCTDKCYIIYRHENHHFRSVCTRRADAGLGRTRQATVSVCRLPVSACGRHDQQTRYGRGKPANHRRQDRSVEIHRAGCAETPKAPWPDRPGVGSNNYLRCATSIAALGAVT